MKASRHIYNPLLSILILVFINGCQKTHKPGQKFSSWKQVTSWSVQGKMSIRQDNKRGSGKFSWLSTKESTDAQFSAALGQGSWKIHEDYKGANLTSSENGNLSGSNAGHLISSELGWRFPWENLPFWLRGFVLNQKLEIHSDLPENISDNSWEISYGKWMNTSIGLLPKVITATKPPYTVKVVIYDWEIR